MSTGHSREETKWKNQEITWDKLVARLNRPTVTKETYARYITLSKDSQMVIKDVGGFVGGTVVGGNRVIGSVSTRQVITLDVDLTSGEFVDNVRMMYDNAFVIHSTHKHSPVTPRYRLIMPLNREVLPDEYEAIARKIAGNIDIESFDPTTFQVERLMFWPSHSIDGQWIFHEQKGNWIDADAILNEYDDWRDTSEWPISERAKKLVRKGISKQEDPCSKKGQIGVFCRAYTIEEAIEKFLPEVYIATDHEDRWTYAPGSTSGGMITYENMFSYSHHSTDPTMGRLCNSFDLVRIHLYGELDKDAKDDTPANKRPSYMKMMELMQGDGKTKKTGLLEKIKIAQGEFGESGEFNNEDYDWMEKLETDKKSTVLPTITNLVIILRNDPNFKDILAYDAFENRPFLKRDLPWRKIDKFSKWLGDSDDSSFAEYFERVYKISNEKKMLHALDIVIMGNKVHPVREYLESIEWDGKPRLERLLIDKLGAEDSEYVREVTRKTLVAAVTRVYEPGCKYDYVLTLKGSQGLGKSRLINQLAGMWYSDTFGNLSTNQAMENIQGVWIMEIGEMAGLKKAEVELIKLFISKQEDRFRAAYGHRLTTYARQSIFIASTNDDTPLRDATGGRRFWIVPVTQKWRGELKTEERNQLWAEACYYYAQGEKLYLTEEVEEIAATIQMENTEYDERTTVIAEYLERLLPANWDDMLPYDRIQFYNTPEDDGLYAKGTVLRDRVQVADIWIELMRGRNQDMTPFNTKFIRTIMNKMPGWESFQYRDKFYGNNRGWRRVAVHKLMLHKMLQPKS